MYRTVVRPALTVAQENKLEVAELRMLRWRCRITKLDRIKKKDRVRRTTRVEEISKKVQGNYADVVLACGAKGGVLDRKAMEMKVLVGSMSIL